MERTRSATAARAAHAARSLSRSPAQPSHSLRTMRYTGAAGCQRGCRESSASSEGCARTVRSGDWWSSMPRTRRACRRLTTGPRALLALTLSLVHSLSACARFLVLLLAHHPLCISLGYIQVLRGDARYMVPVQMGATGTPLHPRLRKCVGWKCHRGQVRGVRRGWFHLCDRDGERETERDRERDRERDTHTDDWHRRHRGKPICLARHSVAKQSAYRAGFARSIL